MPKFIGYVGCWTRPDKSAIHVITLDTDTGEVAGVEVVDHPSPSFLAISPDQKYLYSGASAQDFPTAQKGAVASFAIQPDGRLRFINRCAACSADGPCHLSVSNDGRLLYASHYDEGRAAIFACREDGALFGPIQVIQHEGSGPHPQQDVPHVHYGMDTPDGRFVCFVDLALDAIATYRKLDNGLVEKYLDGRAPRASGARHLTFSPDGRFAYVVSEMAANVSVYLYGDGYFKYLDTVSMLAPDHTGKMSGSAIHIRPDGQYLYAGNRFANRVAVFSRNVSTGYIALKSLVPCALPRDLNITPDGRCLLVCGSEDDALEVYRIDGESGGLTRAGVYRCTAPASVCFLNEPID